MSEQPPSNDVYTPAPEDAIEIVLRGGSLDNLHKGRIPNGIKSVTFESQAPGEVYYLTDEIDGGNYPIYEYRPDGQ